MGIDLQFKRDLRAVIAPAAFQPASSWRRGERPYVAVLDYLTKYKALPRDKPYSLLELFAWFWGMIMPHLLPASSACQAFVVVADDKSNVTRHKGLTQRARVATSLASDERKGLEPARAYPADAVLVAGGVDTGEGVEKIDLRRLGLSRHLSLLDAFFPLIFTAMRAVRPERNLILDYQKDGVWVFDGSSSLPVRFVCEPDVMHNLGEADPALIWWAHFFRLSPYDVHLLTCDTDIIPLWCLYPHTLTHQGVFWHPDNEEMVDLARMAQCANDRYGIERFALACMVAGTDLMHKKHYANGYGVTAILAACALATNTGTLNDTLRHLYGDMWRRAVKATIATTPLPTLDRMRADFLAHGTPVKSIKFPIAEEVEKWETMLAFNCMYWRSACKNGMPTLAA
jgi:hypothetical protein